MKGPVRYSVVPSKEGLPTLLCHLPGGEEVYLHSRVQPEKEGSLFEDRFQPDTYDTLIVLGSGLGYHLLPLQRLGARYAKVLVVEYLPSIDREISRVHLLDFLTSMENLSFLSGLNPDEAAGRLSQLIDLNESKGVQVIEHPASMRAFPEYYDAVKRSIEAILSKQAGDLATRRAFGPRYLRNCMANLLSFPRLYPVRSFTGSLTGHPALVISSGPSLDAHLEKIRDIQEKIIVIAVDSALPVLSAAHITCDFLVSIDPQPFIGEHFLNGHNAFTVPVYSLSAHPVPVARRPGLISLNTHPIAQLIDEISPGAVGSIDSRTGTVAGDAIGLAHLLGLGPLCLLGFDFSFPAYRIYARGTAYQRRYARYAHTRTDPVETWNLRYIMKSSGGFRAGKFYSRKSFMQYKHSLESFIRSHPAPGYFTASRFVAMESAEYTDLEGFLKRSCSVSIDKRGIIASALSQSPKAADCSRLQDIVAALRNDPLRRQLVKASLGHGLDGAAYVRAEEKIASFLSRFA